MTTVTIPSRCIGLFVNLGEGIVTNGVRKMFISTDKPCSLLGFEEVTVRLKALVCSQSYYNGRIVLLFGNVILHHDLAPNKFLLNSLVRSHF